jgi:hypothetical protein
MSKQAFDKIAAGLNQAVGYTQAKNETAWRPIESALKDGRYVLLYGRQCPPAQGVFEDVRWFEPVIFAGYYDEIDQSWCCMGSGWAGPFFDPTHWMPLPAPPSAAADGPQSDMEAGR